MRRGDPLQGLRANGRLVDHRWRDGELLDQAVEVGCQVPQLVAHSGHLCEHQAHEAAEGIERQFVQPQLEVVRQPLVGHQPAAGEEAAESQPVLAALLVAQEQFLQRSQFVARDVDRFARLAAEVAEVFGQAVGHLLRPGQAMLGRVDQAEQPLLEHRARRRGNFLQGNLQRRFQAKAVGFLRALIADHAVQGFDDYLAGRNPREKTALRGEIVQQFAQCRQQVRGAIVAHPLGQNGTKTVYDPVQRNRSGLGAGNDRRVQLLGGDSMGKLRGQEARGIGKGSGGRVGLIQVVASPAYDQAAA